MDFAIPEDLAMIQKLVNDFVNDQLKPLERTILGKAADLSDSITYLPAETEEKLVKMVQELGLWGVGIPDELGGAGLGVLGTSLVEEELAQTILPFNFGDVTPILFDCDENQKQAYFLPALNRQKYAYLALLEPGKQADITAIETTATRDNGHYVLNGRKVSFSRAGNDYFAIVFAVTDPEKGRKGGITCFIVDKDAPGFTIVGGEEKQGWESQTRQPIFLTFDNCKVSADNILGEEGKAFQLGKKWLPQRRIVRAARTVGVGHRLLEEATLQAQNWTAFGQPISKRPSIQAALAEIAAHIHAAELMVYEAAWKADKGDPIRRHAAMVKLFSTQMIHQISDRAAHIWNAPPYIAGQPMERFCRNALADSAVEYGLDLQRNVIASDILKGLRV
jgi:acyl-CoA dehydrogenase